MHIANKPAPEVTARVVELLGGSKAVAAFPQQLQNYLNEICQTFWHNAGGPTELTAADLRKRLNSVSKHLQAANDLINSDLMIAGAVQSVSPCRARTPRRSILHAQWLRSTAYKQALRRRRLLQTPTEIRAFKLYRSLCAT